LISEVFKQFEVPSEEHSNHRLRAYNVQNRIMKETYTGCETQTIEELRIIPFKTLILEQKLANQEFEEFDPNLILLKINVWRPNLQALTEDIIKPSQLSVQKDLLMSEFLSLIQAKFSLENPIVMKRNPMLNQRQLEVLSASEAHGKSLTQLRINEGVNLFVESASTDSKWEHEFELDQNRLQVKFNLPSDKVLEVQYGEYIIVDRRESVLDLKLRIASILGLDISRLVFKRGGTHGVELANDEHSLKQAQFYNMICVFVA
jgi:hypothetical protein